MPELTWKIAFFLVLFAVPAIGLVSTLPRSTPLYARAWVGLLSAVVLAVVAFLITGAAGALPVVAGWLR